MLIFHPDVSFLPQTERHRSLRRGLLFGYPKAPGSVPGLALCPCSPPCFGESETASGVRRAMKSPLVTCAPGRAGARREYQ